HATTEIYTLSLHDALPISGDHGGRGEKQVQPSPIGKRHDHFPTNINSHFVSLRFRNYNLQIINYKYYFWSFSISSLAMRKPVRIDRKSTRLNSSHVKISYA